MGLCWLYGRGEFPLPPPGRALPVELLSNHAFASLHAGTAAAYYAKISADCQPFFDG